MFDFYEHETWLRKIWMNLIQPYVHVKYKLKFWWQERNEAAA